MVKQGYRVVYHSNLTGQWISTDLIVKAESLEEAYDKLVKVSLAKEIEYEIRKVETDPYVYPLEVKFPNGWCKIRFLSGRIID